MPNARAITLLEKAYTRTIGDSFCIDQYPDVIEQLLNDTRSPNTKQAYEKDLKDFFMFIAGCKPTHELVLEFLHLEQRHAVALLLKYKANLIKKELAEATVNRNHGSKNYRQHCPAFVREELSCREKTSFFVVALPSQTKILGFL